MPLVLADRVQETTSTTGTGTVTLLGAVSGFQSFAAVGNGNTTYYCIASQTANEWEVGIGTYTSAGTTLSRTTVLASSNAGSLVNFSAGNKNVFVTYPSSRSIYADGTTLQATNSAVLPVVSGGTGQSSYTDGQLLIGNTTGNTLAKATLTQGTGITITNGAGSITVANAGVTSLTGTTNQVSVSASTGSVTLSTPQSINTTASVQFGSLGVGTAASGTTGEIRATNNITAYYSDDRLKTRLGKIENALDKLCSLDGFYYEANETAQALGYKAVREVGVSAQRMKEILPEIVVPAPIDDKYLTVRYERALPLIVEAIKELRGQVDELKAAVAQLNGDK